MPRWFLLRYQKEVKSREQGYAGQKAPREATIFPLQPSQHAADGNLDPRSRWLTIGCTDYDGARTTTCAGRGCWKSTQHPGHHGRRRRVLEHQRLQSGHDGLSDTQHRPHCARGCAVHRLLRPAVLHRWSVCVHHWTVAISHRPDQSWPAGRDARPAKRRPDDCRAAEEL